MADKEDKKTNPLMNEGSAEDNEVVYSLDTLFGKLGGCARFQVLFVSLGYFPMLPGGWGILFMVFGNYNPGFVCGDLPLVNDSALPEYDGNITQTSTPSRGNFSGHRALPCTCDTIKSNQNWTFSKAASTVVTEWSLVCDDAWKISTIISVQMFGHLLGTYLGGSIGDRFGRKFSVHGGSALLAIANIAAIFSVSWLMFAVVRFFIGFSVGIIFSSLVVYIMEFVSTSWRGFIGIFPFWNVTTISLGLCIMALKNWRHIHIATAFVAFIGFLPVFWLPESLRHLTVHGHLRRANQVVKEIATINKKPLPDTNIMSKIAEIEKEALEERTGYTYLDLFHRSIRKHAVVFGLIWFALSVANNTIGFGLKALPGDFFVNLLVLFSLPFPARASFVIIAAKFGRKTALATCIFLSAMLAFLLVVLQLSAAADTESYTTTALALVSNVFIEAGWGVAIVMNNELFPTDVRNMGNAFCSSLGRIGSIVAPYLIPRKSLPIWSVFLTIGILLLMSFVSVLTLPETKGRPLRENLQVKRNENPEK